MEHSIEQMIILQKIVFGSSNILERGDAAIATCTSSELELIKQAELGP